MIAKNQAQPKPFIFGYNRFTKAGRMLAKSIKGTFSYPQKGDAPGPNDPVINWGSSYVAPWMWGIPRIINRPDAVKKAINKLTTFKILAKAGLPIPEFTTDLHEGFRWIQEGGIVYARERLTAAKGEGCTVYHLAERKAKVALDDIDEVKVFTKGFRSHWEFKVHIINGKLDHVIRVGRDEDFVQDPYIRNHNNGWTFYDEARPVHPEIERVCIAAVQALGLDFGIVDIGVGKGQGQMCIYEVNTAPGGEQADIDMYIKAFKKEFGINKGA